jgi:hypothetical protein
LLVAAISELLAGSLVCETVRLEPHQARLRSQLYEKDFIEQESVDENGAYVLSLRLPESEFSRLREQGVMVLPKSESTAQAQSEWPESRAETVPTVAGSVG